MAFCTFWYFRCPTVGLFSLVAKDLSHEHNNRQLQAGDGGLSDLYDDTDYIALHMLLAPDSMIFINEFESGQNHRNSSDVHDKESL